jgi:5-methylcytosine-specific restriction endonuclease McrA
MKKHEEKVKKAARGDPQFEIESAWFPVPRNPNKQEQLRIIRILHQEFCPCCHARLDYDNAHIISVRSSGKREYGHQIMVCEDCVDDRECSHKRCNACPPGKSVYAIFRYQKWKEDPYCYYCETRMRLCDTTVDHVVPKSKGGEDRDKGNFVLSCRTCNRDKDSMSEEEFMDKLDIYLDDRE